jgi:hypothetical protein
MRKHRTDEGLFPRDQLPEFEFVANAPSSAPSGHLLPRGEKVG